MKTMFRSIVAALAAVASFAATPASAQTCPTFTHGLVLTAGQWQACFNAKQNALGYTPLNVAGGTMMGPLITMAPTTAAAGLRLPHGSAPSSPANGDLWTTTAGAFIQIDGTTIGPLSSSGASSFAATAPLAVTFPASVVTYAMASTTSGNLIANSSASSAAPTATTPTAWFDRWCSSTNGQVPYRTGGSWGCVSFDPPTPALSTVLTPAMYNATCDGIVDDTTPMRNWVAALSSTKKSGSLAGKTCLVTGSLTLTDDTKIAGPGTITYQGVGRPIVVNGDRVELRNFTLTGNQSGSYVAANDGIYLLRSTFVPLVVTYAEGLIIDGVRISGFGDSCINLYWADNFRISKNHITNCGFRGIATVSATNGIISENHVEDIEPGTGGLRYGILVSRNFSSPMLKIADSPAPTNVRISANLVKNLPNYTCIDTHGGNHIVVEGNQTTNCRIGLNLEHATMAGTAQAGAAGSITLPASAQNTDDYYNGLMALTTGGTGSGQYRLISDYVASTKVATVSANFTTPPDNTTTFVLLEPEESGTAQAGSTASTIVLASAASADDDAYNGKMIYIIAGTGLNQNNLITDYVGSTRTASVANSWGVTPDNTSVYATFDYYNRGGVTVSALVAANNTFDGVGASDTVGPAIAVDAWSGGGETSRGVIIRSNTIRRHGHQSGSTFSVGGAILATETEGLIVDGNVCENCLGRFLAASTNAVGTKAVNNTILNLQASSGVHVAFETTAATASLLMSMNTMHGVSYGSMIEVGSFNTFKGVVADYLNQSMGHTAFGGVYPTFLTANSIARIKGTIVGAPRVMAMFDGTGATGAKSLGWSMVTDLRFSAPTVNKDATGVYTITWPSGIFGNVKVAAFASGADPASGEIRTAVITACSSTSCVFKFFDAASAAAIDPVDVWIIGTGR